MAKDATSPTRMFSDRPDLPARSSAGTPHSGAMRGKNRNSATMTGAPHSASLAAVRSACINGGLPAVMWALTSAVSRPISPSTMAAAVSSDCE